MHPYLRSFCWQFVLSAVCGQACFGQMRVLVNQVGYEVQEPKQAIVSSSPHESPREFSLVDSESGKIVLKGSLRRVRAS